MLLVSVLVPDTTALGRYEPDVWHVHSATVSVPAYVPPPRHIASVSMATVDVPAANSIAASEVVE